MVFIKTLKKRMIVVAVIFCPLEKKLVMIERKGDASHAEFPGGKVEAGETREEGLLREVGEEVKMEVKILDWLPDVIEVEDKIITAAFCEFTGFIEGKSETKRFLVSKPDEALELGYFLEKGVNFFYEQVKIFI